MSTYISRMMMPRKTSKVRIGDNLDGGYVLPSSSLEDCSICVTYGLGHNISFERHFEQMGMKLVGFDVNTHGMPSWARTKSLKSYRDFMEIEDIDGHENILLKMDIEGAEWGFIDSMEMRHFSEKVHTFVFEMHIGYKPKEIPMTVLDKIFESHHLVHIHANNFGHVEGGIPMTTELTFLNKRSSGDLVFDNGFFPVMGLDFANNPHAPEIRMSWLSQNQMLL